MLYADDTYQFDKSWGVFLKIKIILLHHHNLDRDSQKVLDKKLS